MRLRSITFVIIVALSAGSATAAPGAGIKRNHYPGLPAPAKTALWLVAKCKVADDATVTAGLDQNISDFFGDSGIGYGNLFDYFYDVSYHQYRFRTRIMDSWLTAPFNKAALLPDGKLFGSEKRRDRVEQCLQAIPVELAPDLDRFAGVAVITNFVKDGGACTPGTLTAGGKTRGLPCVWMDEKSLFTDFAAHEIGHGLGLGHSFDSLSSDCGAAPGEYCDPWDLMSAMRTFSFKDDNWPIVGGPSGGGPGLNAPALLAEGWIPRDNQRTFDHTLMTQKFMINALSHPTATGTLVILVYLPGTGPSDGVYTIEFRQADGWDRGFADNAPDAVKRRGGAVLVHRMGDAGSPLSTLMMVADRGGMIPGHVLTLPGSAGTYHVRVEKFDLAAGTAIVEVGQGDGVIHLPDTVMK